VILLLIFAVPAALVVAVCMAAGRNKRQSTSVLHKPTDHKGNR
jgi:hypothetical protein